MKEKVSLPDLREGTGLMPQHLPQDHIKPFTELLIETIDEFRRPDAPDFRPAFLTYSEWVKAWLSISTRITQTELWIFYLNGAERAWMP
jgi:hypothetical protein